MRTIYLHKISYNKTITILGTMNFLLFFAIGLTYMVTGTNIGNLVFGMLILLLFVHGVYVRKFNMDIIILCIMYLCLLILSLVYTTLNGIPLQYGIVEMFYYLKPMMFFLLGYCIISRDQMEKLYIYVLIYMVVGTLCFYLAPDYFISKTMIKIGDADQANTGLLYAFEKYIRNTSFLLSALETSFVMFFISFHYFYCFINHKTKKHFLLFLVATIILISAIARSSLLGTLLAIIIHLFIVMKPLRRIYTSLILLFCLASFIYIFRESFELIFFKDGSASIHHENLHSAISHIRGTYFFPSGLGASGWITAGMPFNVYSEGSMFTSIIENGAVFVLVYLGILYMTYKYYFDYLFPIFLGYILTSLMIPIGFSTLFNLLFFSSFGMRYKNNTKLKTKLSSKLTKPDTNGLYAKGTKWQRKTIYVL